MRSPDAVGLLARHGSAFMRTARRYAHSPEDAEDAYQRAVEILLTKAPDVPEAELVPWMKTVVKHEAFALRRQRDRAFLGSDDSFDGDGAADRALHAVADPHEQTERIERLRLGAEALRRLKPQEVRCLTLLAEGYSYKQIQEITGWTYTKVNRCLAEGRRSFLERLAGIESGAECERLRPALSAFADGEASAEDVSALRPHLRSCLSCRATLRGYRETPARVAALVPPVLGLGPLGAALERTLDAAREWLASHLTGVVAKARAGAELMTAPKLAAATAGVVIAAGGAGGIALSAGAEEPASASSAAVAVAAPADRQLDDRTRRGAQRASASTERRTRPVRRPERRRGAPVRASAAAPAEQSVEPAAAPSSPAATTSPSTPASPPRASSAPAAPAPPASAPAGDSGGEFGP